MNGSRATTRDEARADGDPKAATRAMWAMGDYHQFAKSTVWVLGRELVEACGIGPGQRVLDVAAGTGNTAIRAAETGADVIASDLTPENFEAGREEARALGVSLEWVEADAEALPFDDAEFDVVTSSVGAIFVPNHEAVARELLRVCKPGGTIGMINFRPEGLAKAFFELVARYAPPPPPGASPPLRWGDEDHVRRLFGDELESLEVTPGVYVERAPTPQDYHDLFMTTFGPVIALRAALGAADPARADAFDQDFRDFAEAGNQGPPEGPAEYPYPYVRVLARKRGGK